MKAQQSSTEAITGDCNQFDETRGAKANKRIEKFRDPAFRDRLVVGFTLAITLAPLIFLIGMYIVQVYVWR